MGNFVLDEYATSYSSDRRRVDLRRPTRLPAMRQQLVEILGRVVTDACEHVAQILPRVDAVGLAARHQRLQPAEVLARLVAAEKQPVLAPHSDRS